MRELWDDDDDDGPVLFRSNPPFFAEIFFFSSSSSSSSSRARQTERDSEWRFEGVFCLSLSVSASFFARAFLLCSFLDDGFVLSSWGVLLLLGLD